MSNDDAGDTGADRSDSAPGAPRDDGASASRLFPISDERIERGFYLVLFAWVGYLMWISLDLNRTSRMVPLLVGVPVLVLIGMQLVPVDWTALFDRILPGSADRDADDSVGLTDRLDGGVGFDPAKRDRIAATMIAWCGALVVVIYVLGYYYGLPPYVFALSLYFHRDVRKAAILAVLFTIGATFLFVVLFDVILYNGILGLPNPSFFF